MEGTPGLFEELKQRKVFRVATMYAIAGWVILQIGEVTFEPLGLPEGSLKTLIFLVAMGFPVAVALGWMFDWTSEGIVLSRGHPAQRTQPEPAGNRIGLRRWAGVAVTLVALVIGYGGYRAYTFWTQFRWAQDVAHPELIKRIELNDFVGAFQLATELEATFGEMPVLKPVWSIIGADVKFETEPPGALVSYRRYDDPEAQWTSLGETPIPTSRVPRAPILWRIEKPGYVTREIARVPASGGGEQFQWPSDYVLDPVTAASGDTVAVEGREYFQVSLGGFPVAEAYTLDRFFIDRTEVRNAHYQEFVTAGGYKRPEFWTVPFRDGDRTLSFTEAMTRFTDSTGRTGPATWIAGRYPSGQGDHPVAGVSWFEAQAYARFRGRALPTAYHWAAAALPDIEIIAPLAPALAAQSNLNSAGTLPVGSTTGLSAAGASDMFGNVAEWVSTARGDELRFSLGLGWPDPAYGASMAPAAPPWSRLSSQGFRLATYPGGEPDAKLLAPVEISLLDYETLEPLSESALEMLAKMNAFTPAPVRSSETAIELPNGMRAVRVEVDAPYTDETLPLLLLIPDETAPPYQAIVWFGGMNAVSSTDNTTLYNLDMAMTNFIRQSGRILVMPIWTGTFERNDGSTFRRFGTGSTSRREIINAWSKDFHRTIDYLETRQDVDSERIAFLGLSLGSAIGAHLVPGERRLRTAIFWSGGFPATSDQESAVLAASFARRIKVPALMLNGRHDFIFPFELQQAFFRMLGTPEAEKRHVVFDTGHIGWPLGEFVRENLDWLDRYMGPVSGPD